MDVFLVRHAKAGVRHKWEGPDDLRPLSKKGRKQAERLAALLGEAGVTRILSSPSVRCVETVQPLADGLDLKVEETDALAEGVAPEGVVTLARDVARDSVAVLCTHGDVIPILLDTLTRTDGLDLPDDYPCAKGSTWRLRTDGSGRFVDAEYIAAS
ncbi:MAG: histidine phosphatase family protein [Actinomycetota bacterium]|nr:histidine phosphatase family protein [Actinomycetota bacterium]